MLQEKKKTVATSQHQPQHIAVVENEIVFQQSLNGCTMKTKRMVIEKMVDIVERSTAI